MTNKRPHSAALIYSGINRKLCGQYFSAFSSSCSQHFSAVCCSHSFSEAVFSASLSFFRLECHFHCRCTSFIRYHDCPFMSTATIIVKKPVLVKKKIHYKQCKSWVFSKIGFFIAKQKPISGRQSMIFLFVYDRISHAFLTSLYVFHRILQKELIFLFFPQQKYWDLIFLIAVVDNFCYTYDKHCDVDKFHTIHIRIYHVIHKLLITMCITFYIWWKIVYRPNHSTDFVVYNLFLFFPQNCV